MAKKEVVSVIQDSLFQLSFQKLESTNSRFYLVECVLVSPCVTDFESFPCNLAWELCLQKVSKIKHS